MINEFIIDYFNFIEISKLMKIEDRIDNRFLF